MGRHTRAQIARNPELGRRDMEATRRACEKFRDLPVTVVNYLEGTRFTPAKQAAQGSPYRHLLKPKAGGVAFVLATLGEQLDAILDVTLVYPEGRAPGFWALASGQLPRVIVDIRTRELDPALCQGDYENDPLFRQFVQQWVSGLWAEKDARIDELRAQTQAS
jgi:1-acyl-sn-glycerol-3-phosphate acyltransferase